jgi:hypothetical protein
LEVKPVLVEVEVTMVEVAVSVIAIKATHAPANAAEQCE